MKRGSIEHPWLAMVLGFCGLLVPAAVLAATAPADLTETAWGVAALVVFLFAYVLVVAEEFTEMRKSKPVVIAAGIIWFLVALAFAAVDRDGAVELLRHNLLDYAGVMLFLICAMTYVNTMAERNLFEALRARLIAAGFGLRALFWLTGLLAFFLSPVLDNLTTALVMGAVALAVGAGHPRFVALACINIVVAANAGGAFSPFGDITTLMVWQAGRVEFWDFMLLFVPSVVNWLLPAAIMSFAVPRERPAASSEAAHVKPGGFVVAGLFASTILITVSGHNALHLPPFLGMMTGLGLLQVYGYFIRRAEHEAESEMLPPVPGYKPTAKPFDIFISMKRVEWDTLMFFYGVVLCVGGLGALGYLAGLSQWLYLDLGATTANITVGIASAIVDNIPIMFAVLSMSPDMPLGQWLLVTLTAGVGGSLLSIGSAAGVALMGQARGVYTFFAHLRWTWAVGLGYAASIWVHFALNGRLFPP